MARPCTRLHGVVIEQRPAIELLRHQDGPDVLHYVDPPYLPETRIAHDNMYRHEMSFDDHAELLDVLDTLEGAVVLSGYPSELYQARLAHWRLEQRDARDSRARTRTECLWLNGRASAGTRQTNFDFTIASEASHG